MFILQFPDKHSFNDLTNRPLLPYNSYPQSGNKGDAVRGKGLLPPVA
ncbi:hypothetical protein PSDVSF_08270 [Pseudodesulfovibrio sediminis]|uniref:Uncharacterized protein n=1 Tax=Pseudodesulfovibrio sediminis TaxID=2810563 RepID=A0ABN6EQ96_9BACT|nr:hypothetical protein PSDVSF_08270 [Pseudodesulfovibrio sediminis]